MKGWSNILTNTTLKSFKNGALKHNIVWDTKLGEWYRKSLMHTALFFMKTARKMLRRSAGRCSYCGANCGFDSTMSRKGLRCSNKKCQNYPYV